MWGRPRADWKDRPCWRCGYPLRNLPGVDVRNCPECGLPIRVSLSGSGALQMADPQWLRMVGISAGLAATGAALCGGGLVALFLLVAEDVRRGTFAAATVFAVGNLMTLASWWLMAIDDRNHRPRPIMRAFIKRALLSIALFGLLFLQGWVAIRFAASPAAFAIAIPCTLLVLLAETMMLGHANEWMTRSGHRPLRRWLPRFEKACAAAWALVIPAVIALVISWTTLSDAPVLAILVALLGEIASLAIAAAWVKIAGVIRADRRMALATWTSD